MKVSLFFSIISTMDSLGKLNKRVRRNTIVLVAQESIVDKNVQFTNIEPSVIERVNFKFFNKV